MADIEVAVPGVAGRVSISEPGLFIGARVLIDGVPIKRMFGNRFTLRKVDGTTTIAKLQANLGQYFPTLVVDNVRYEIGEKLPKVLLVLSFLPFCLVFVGGALGGLCGGLGWSFNNQLARTSIPMTVKVFVMLIVTGVSALVFFTAATLFTLAIGH